MNNIKVLITGLIYFCASTILASGADFRIRNSTTTTLEIMTHKNDGTENSFQVSKGATHELATPSSLAKLQIKETGAEFLHPWQSVNLPQARSKFNECGPIEVKVSEKAGLEKGIVLSIICQN